MTSQRQSGRGWRAQRIPPPLVQSRQIRAVVRRLSSFAKIFTGAFARASAWFCVCARAFVGAIVCAVALQGCIPIISAPDWQLPVRLGGQLYSVPVPTGMVETCAGNPADYDARSATLAASSTLVACVETPAGVANTFAGLITTAVSGSDADAEFAQYKGALVAQAAAAQAEAAGDRRLAGRSRVMRVLRQGKRWTVHAVYAGQHDGSGRTGVIATGLVRDRLFYLSVLSDADVDASEGTNWPELTERAVTWVRSLLSKNLVPVLAAPSS
jgi:hypothetical protein